MDQLIYLKSTGSPEEFAELLNVSIRTLYYYLKIMKELGAEIKYNPYSLSYEYLNEKRLIIGY